MEENKVKEKNITTEDAFYEKYINLARSRAHKALGGDANYYRIDFEDLVQEAMIAGLEAIRKFDSSKGYAESTYVVTSMDNAIARYIRENFRAFRTNQPQNKMITTIGSLMVEVDENGNHHSLEEISDLSGYPMKDVLASINANQMEYSLDYYCSRRDDDEQSALDKNDMLSTENESKLNSFAENNVKNQNEVANVIREIINNVATLSTLEKEIYIYRKGLFGIEPVESPVLAKKYNITPTKCSLMFRKASAVIEAAIKQDFYALYGGY